VQAKSAVLMDAATGVVLYGKDMHARRPIASTTKIMTALVTLESAARRGSPIHLDDWVTVSENATKVEPSSLALKPGERMQLNDLLAALLLKSANDAAIAIAEHVGGNVPAFAGLMNARAQELGATDTHFVNPHGLFDADHHSSAYDLGLITREALKYARFRELVATKAAEVFRPDTASAETVENHNKLLWRSGYVDGVKTGWVSQSGQCIVASATRNGWQLIAVLLDSPDKYGEALALLDYGFAAFQRKVFAEKGDVVARAGVSRGRQRSVPAVCSQALATVIGPGLTEEARLEVTTKRLVAPVAMRAPVGEARLVVAGRVVSESPLLAGHAIAVSRPVVVGVWALRVLALLALAAVTVRTGAKIVKARRRGGRSLPPQGRGSDPRRPGPG
jgi:D-alanyl-D-alanine carboxypeptidase (penicillin-binding protein 5/6)